MNNSSNNQGCHQIEEAISYVENLPNPVQQSLLLFLLERYSVEESATYHLSREELGRCINGALQLLVKGCASANNHSCK